MSITEWFVKTIIISKVNKLLGNYSGNVDKVRDIMKKWIARLQKVLECCQKLLAKLDDGKLSVDEMAEAAEDISTVVKEW